MRIKIKENKKSKKIRDDAINAKRFIRLDVGGRDIYESVYKFIEDNIIAKGGAMGKDTKRLTAKAIIDFANIQLNGVRKRSKPRLDAIINHCSE
jgi:hypothetical protein